MFESSRGRCVALDTPSELLRAVRKMPRRIESLHREMQHLREAIGRIEGRQILPDSSSETQLARYEFKIYSQWGEDGIIQYLTRTVPIGSQSFVEFGCSDYTEANTRFLSAQGGWGGLLMDASAGNIAAIKRDPIYWARDLTAVQAFVTRESINGILVENGLAGEVGLLSIDIDGNDYWVWEAISVIQPTIVVIEYNYRFGSERCVAVPYDPNFRRELAHQSCIYFGASLAALYSLAHRKGYAFVGCESNGVNAFFVRHDRLPSSLTDVSPTEGFRMGSLRESKDASGRLAYLSHADEEEILAALPLVALP